MSLAQPELLLAAPLLLALLGVILRRGRPEQTAGARIARLWADRRGLRALALHRRLRGRGLAAGLGVLAVVVALARPQWGTREEIEVEPAREVLLALDLSRSMLTEDVAPSRLARARLLIEGLLAELRGERVGLVLFAGTAFLQSPLSADYEVMRDLLPELEVGYLPQGGTDYGAMLDAALDAFGSQPAADRFLIVLSDGESHDASWRDRLPRVQEIGVRILCLGLGSEAGALVPDGQGGVVKDERGAAVLSRLEAGTLRELAEASDGVYRDAAAWVDLAALVEQTVARGRRGDFAETRSERRIERFQWLLAPGVLLLLLSAWLELPAAPVARPASRRRPPARSAKASLATSLIGLVAVLSMPAARAAESGAPDPLLETVAELASRPRLGAADYARLAEATVQHADAAAAGPGAAARGGSERGVVEDGLLAVTVGESLDPEAADWTELRRRLEALAQRPPLRPAGDSPGASPPQTGSRSGSGNGGDDDSSQTPPGEAPSAGAQDSQQAGSSGEGKGEGEREGASGAGGEPDPAEGTAGSADPAAAEGSEGAERSDPSTAAAPVSPRGEPLAAESRESDGETPGVAGEASNAQSAEPATRLVGGSDDAMRELLAEHPELAGALGRMEKVRGDDSPSRLFQRLDESEGRRQAASGRDW